MGARVGSQHRPLTSYEQRRREYSEYRPSVRAGNKVLAPRERYDVARLFYAVDDIGQHFQVRDAAPPFDDVYIYSLSSY